MGKIKELRQAKKMTQAELAKLLGIDRTTVSQWEIGKNKPRASMLIQLADVFDCDIDSLLRT